MAHKALQMHLYLTFASFLSTPIHWLPLWFINMPVLSQPGPLHLQISLPCRLYCSPPPTIITWLGHSYPSGFDAHIPSLVGLPLPPTLPPGSFDPLCLFFLKALLILCNHMVYIFVYYQPLPLQLPTTLSVGTLSIMFCCFSLESRTVSST